MNKDEQVTEIHDGTDAIAMLQAIRDLQQGYANGQDERITPLEAAAKAIFSLQKQVTTLKKDVKRLEAIALEAVEAEAIANLRTTAIEHAKRIEELEARAVVTGSAIDAAIQDERMIELERQINTLYAEAARQAERITPLEAAVKAIFSLQQQVTAQKERIEQPETCAVINAETIGQVEQLKVAVVEQGMRIEKLEVRLAADTTDFAAMIIDVRERIEQLETVLRNVIRCLINGKVDVDMALPDAIFRHSHRILGTESVEAMVEIYHRLKG